MRHLDPIEAGIIRAVAARESGLGYTRVTLPNVRPSAVSRAVEQLHLDGFIDATEIGSGLGDEADDRWEAGELTDKGRAWLAAN
jgi:hypothetical protein